METLFLSSVQGELAEHRRAVRAFVEGDPLLRRFFRVFLFEDIPAADRRPDQVYLEKVATSALYVGLFGRDYGFEDAEGVSPTEREFDEATRLPRPRLVYLIGDGTGRHPKMAAFIARVAPQLIRRRVGTIPELTAALYSSLVERLVQLGLLQDGPFEQAPCATPYASATEADLSPEAVATFVRRARTERQFPLPDNTPVATVLTHLNLLAGATPSRAAVLLFGREPTRWLPSAEIRCMHFHGTEVARPVPLYQIFKGTVFEQVDLATNFVLSVINRSVGTRAESSAAPVAYELPPDVVREAIVNALVHRDYASAAAVQVSVFADRVEVRNPGDLTPPLTPAKLREPHASLARNARLCEALFLARYIEKYGTGTLMMIRESRAHALAEPDFAVGEGEFVVTLWRDWLTPEVLAGLNLNERHLKTLTHLKTHGKISNRECQELTGSSERTALRDLGTLERLLLVRRLGMTGRNAYYVVAKKPAVNPPNVPTPAVKHPDGNRAIIVPNASTLPATSSHPAFSEAVKPGTLKGKAAKVSPKTPVTPQATTQATPQANPLVQNPLAVLAGVLGLPTPQATPQAAQQVAALLRAAQDDAQPRETLQTASGLADREHFRQAYLEPLLKAGWFERTLPEKRTSPHQRYRLAAAGRTWLHAYTLPSA